MLIYIPRIGYCIYRACWNSSFQVEQFAYLILLSHRTVFLKSLQSRISDFGSTCLSFALYAAKGTSMCASVMPVLYEQSTSITRSQHSLRHVSFTYAVPFRGGRRFILYCRRLDAMGRWRYRQCRQRTGGWVGGSILVYPIDQGWSFTSSLWYLLCNTQYLVYNNHMVELYCYTEHVST